jgi:hypothetical protein
VISETQLLKLARLREDRTHRDLGDMLLKRPHQLRIELRQYLARQVDYGRLERTNPNLPQLETTTERLKKLLCPELEFQSGARLFFSIHLVEEQGGCLVTQFEFHLHLPSQRRIKMVRIELNPDTSRDPLLVPRCHLHIDDSKAHVPFPVMDARLILHLICEHIEPDFGS